MTEEDRKGGKHGPQHRARMLAREQCLKRNIEGQGRERDSDNLIGAKKGEPIRLGSIEAPVAKKREPIRLGSTEAPFTSNPETVAEVAWVAKGLRVRVVDEDGKFRESHLRKGEVYRVVGAGEVGSKRSGFSASIRLDDGGQELEAVPQELLETVCSKRCTRVEVVRGVHQGKIADILERDARQNSAVVRLPKNSKDGGEDRVELRLDDVCEFCS